MDGRRLAVSSLPSRVRNGPARRLPGKHIAFPLEWRVAGKMTQLDLDQSGSNLTRLRRHMRRGVPAQRRRLMVLSGFACAFAMVGVAAAVLSALL